MIGGIETVSEVSEGDGREGDEGLELGEGDEEGIEVVDELREEQP